MIEFTVPGNPLGWQRAAPSPQGHTYDPAQNKERKKEIAILARIAMGSAEPMDGALVAEMTFYMKPPKKWARAFPTTKPDIDNMTKLVLDALNGVAYNDDAQIVGLVAWKVYIGEDGVFKAKEPCSSVSIRYANMDEGLPNPKETKQ